MTRLGLRSQWPLAQGLIMLGALLAAFFRPNAEVVERWFTGGWYPAVQRTLTPVSNLLPIAWLDLLAVAVAVWVIRLWWRRPVLLAIRITLVTAAATYLTFLVLWGFNYDRMPLLRRLVVDRPTPATDAVVRLGMQAVQRLNALYSQAHQTGWPEPVWRSESLVAAARRVQARLGAPRPSAPGRLKHSLFGPVFRWNGVDGMVNPFGLEVIANPDLLPFERPFVMAHEWAHLAGYAEESEANFVGWLTCLEADVGAQYSGWLYLYWQIAGELGQQQRDGLTAALSGGPRRDIQAITDRLRRGDIPMMRRASWAAYDQYLKANRVEAGVRSYGEVVNLILRAHFEDGWHPVLREAARP